jgi:hypothetical protein
MLKEMIERKRRNDFVRKREFDMLRKMRRSEVMAGQDPAARPSFFQSSMPSKPDDRATTLKKIDEIEAQMSMQWWKTKHGENSRQPGGATNFPVSAHVPPEAMSSGAPLAPQRSTAYTKTEPSPLQAAKEAEKTAPADLSPMLDFPSSELEMQPPAPPRAQPVVPVAAPAPAFAGRGATPMARPPQAPAITAVTTAEPNSEPGGNTGFSASKLFAIDVDEFAHDPELEEASIRFANGDDAGAAAGLMEVLGPQGARIDHDETWLTLFDLYRASGQ